MLGFGELRKFSAQWQVDITAVERVYVIAWLLKGIFDHAPLAQSLVLRGGAALRFAYCADFPIADDPEFIAAQPIEEKFLREALTAASDASGLKLSLVSYERGAAKIEYTGPLGRRSAAQPRVIISILGRKTRLEPSPAPLLHPFSDLGAATLRVIALDETVGEQIAALAGSPRAREVYDLWFELTRMPDRVNAARVRHIAQEIARERNAALPRADAVFSATHRAVLGRAWENALREARGHPPLTQVENDLAKALKIIFAV